MKRFILLLLYGIFLSTTLQAVAIWGFFAHKKINQLAVFTLPPEMVTFFKKNISYLEETAVNPDKRRYIVKEEGARHYIDLDAYPPNTFPLSWDEALARFTADTLQKHGILPWHLEVMKKKLTHAFKENKHSLALKYAAEAGHYIADAHVPLHTTRNYNGQYTNQHGIHGLWESRLPELFFNSYDFFVGQAEYIENTQQMAWDIVLQSNMLVDSVLTLERIATQKSGTENKYGYEERGTTTVRVYSKEFSAEYHKLLNGMVERRMREAVKMTGNFWYTCWVDAGKPALSPVSIQWEEIPEAEQKNINTAHDCVH